MKQQPTSVQAAAGQQQTEAPSPVQGIVAQHTATAGLVQATVGQQSAALGLGVPGAVGHKQRPPLNLSMVIGQLLTLIN